MSLKAFHITFITLASAVSAGCAVWAFKLHGTPEAQPWQMWFGGGAALVSLALVIYGRSFLKKMKHVSYL